MLFRMTYFIMFFCVAKTNILLIVRLMTNLSYFIQIITHLAILCYKIISYAFCSPYYHVKTHANLKILKYKAHVSMVAMTHGYLRTLIYKNQLSLTEHIFII